MPPTLSRRRFLELAALSPIGSLKTADPGVAHIGVDAGQTLWQIPATVRGFNFWGTRSDAVFMPEYQKIGVNLLRFPPGRDGDERNLSATLMDDSGKVARALGGDLVVEARLRGGTPEQAAANVRYMNIDHPYKARYWEIGNEPDLYARRGGEPDFSPGWYSEQFRAYSQAMKAVDPAITIFGPVLSHKLDEWMRPFITACGDSVDGLSWHFYGGGDKINETELLASTARFDQQVAMVRTWWSDPAINPKGHMRQIPLLISEYGASYVTNNPRNLTTQAAAIWTADMLGHLVTQRIDLAAYFTLWGINYHGVWSSSGQIRPVYYSFLLFNQFGNQLLRAESDQPLLPAYAALREDGALSLMLVNKHPTEAYTAQIDIQRFAPSGPPQILQHSQELKGVPVPYNGLLAPLSITCPPYSTTMVIVPGTQASADLPLWGALGLGAAALIAGGAAWRYRRLRRSARNTPDRQNT